jgi:hypothetical protein
MTLSMTLSDRLTVRTSPHSSDRPSRCTRRRVVAHAACGGRRAAVPPVSRSCDTWAPERRGKTVVRRRQFAKGQTLTRFVVLDTETTGLVADRERVVWIAAAVLDDSAGRLAVTSRWSTLLDPGTGSRVRVGPIELAGQPTFAAVEPHLTGLLEGSVLVGHNAAFDIAFLAAEYRRIGRRMPNVPVLCTLQLTKLLNVDVASYGLVDCCAQFGVIHQRRHRADEDVEATVQLLGHLLPVATARGWTTIDTVLDALAAVGAGGSSGLSARINVDNVLADLLISTVGWQPDTEPLGDALGRYAAHRRAEHAAWLGTMSPAHRAAHEALDVLDAADERDAQRWLPALEQLAAVGCPLLERAQAWTAYGRQRRRCHDPVQAVDACGRALDVGLAAPGVARVDLRDAVWELTYACHEADMAEALIDAYRRFGPRLAALAPCGSCGNLTEGCRGGRACRTADLAGEAAWEPFHTGFDADGEPVPEDPARVERLARAVLPLLAAERVLDGYVQAASRFVQELLEWSRPDEVLWVWTQVTGRCAGRDVPGLAEQAGRVAKALAHAKRFADACTVIAPAVAWARQQANPELLWQLGDDLGFWLERVGRPDEALVLWRELVDAGSDVLRTYDRLSLALDRAGDPAAAARVVRTGLGRFRGTCAPPPPPTGWSSVPAGARRRWPARKAERGRRPPAACGQARAPMRSSAGRGPARPGRLRRRARRGRSGRCGR